MESTLKVKIQAVSEVLVSASVKSTTHRQIVTVVEIPRLNPYGKDYSKQIPFDVEIHNKNIDEFAITKNHIGETAEIEIVFSLYKKDAAAATEFKLLVNQLNIIL